MLHRVFFKERGGNTKAAITAFLTHRKLVFQIDSWMWLQSPHFYHSRGKESLMSLCAVTFSGVMLPFLLDQLMSLNPPVPVRLYEVLLEIGKTEG